MLLRRMRGLFAAAAVVALSACSTSTMTVASLLPSPSPATSSSPQALPTQLPALTPSPSHKPTPKPRPKVTLKATVPAGGDIGKPHPSPTPTPSDGVPVQGAGTFSVASGGTDVVGAGTTLVAYRVEVENGIDWGTNPVWTPDSFAAAVDGILADPRGWTASAQSPVTDPAQHLANASWSFQRVSGTTFSVRVLLATPNTVDKMCASVGLQTQGIYSCRYGKTVLINLRRWLRGATTFSIDLAGYRMMVVNHEVGHFLGFAHMLCPGAGQPAPVMQQQTISLGACQPNPYPFAADGTFITGPWAPS
jgi:uncharacterized protein DUF3152